jgi:hypothetical protein
MEVTPRPYVNPSSEAEHGAGGGAAGAGRCHRDVAAGQPFASRVV